MPRTPKLAVLLLVSLSCVSSGPQERDTGDPYAGLVWPPPPDEPRIKLELVLRGRADVEASSKWQRRLLGASPRSPFDRLRKPFAVAFDGEGRILVTDSANGALIRFDPPGRRMDVLGTRGQMRLKLPLGIDLAPDGTIYVADALLAKVVALAPDGTIRSVYGRQGELTNPTDAAISPDGSRLYVADSKAHRIVVFATDDGRIVSSFGQRGLGPGELNFPTSLVFGSDGSLFVVDQLNSRVQVLSQEGDYLDEFGSLGVGFASFVRPKDVAVDETGWIYVTDNAFNNFQLFDAEHRLLTYVGEAGWAPGRFQGASGIAVQGDRIAVVDQLGARVQIFRYLGPEARRFTAPMETAPAETAEMITLEEPSAPAVESGQPRGDGAARIDATPRTAPTEEQPAASTSPPEATLAAPEVAATEAPGLEPSEAEGARGRTRGIEDTVRAWARAWAEQRSDDYLAYYSMDFRPDQGTERGAWEATRRRRLGRPRFIEIVLDSLRVASEGPRQATVTFVQTYRSDRFSDRVLKTLHLVLEAGGWRIVEESVDEVLQGGEDDFVSPGAYGSGATGAR